MAASLRLVILLFLCVLFIIISTSKFKFHPFLVLLFAGLGFGLFSGMPLTNIVKSINGGTIGYIGTVIAA